MQNYSKKIDDAISKFKGSEVIPIASDGEWSMHQLLEYLLGISGPAKVWISSFSVTEVAIRTFLNLHDSGLLQELHCLFDFTVKRHKVGLLFFANNVSTEIAIDKCHAKLILIQNENFTITVVGSANFNINDKKEVAVIHFGKWFFDFYHALLTGWIASGLKVSNDEFK